MGVNCSSGRGSGVVIHDIRDGLNYKILLLGDSGVGKTSIFRRFVENTFDPVHRPTTRPLVKNVLQKINVPGDYVISITVWDIPIKEDIDMRESYYRNVDAVIVVTDLTDPTSIKLAGVWKQDFVSNATKTFTVTEVLPNGHRTTTVKKTIFNPYDVPFLLLGNKFDQIEDRIKEKRLQEVIQKPILEEFNTPTVEEEGSDLKISESPTEEKDNKITKRYYTEDGKDSNKYEKPECVALLEESETKYNFIGSILVSAKLSDSSVDLAFQAVIRHLLNKTKPEKEKEEVEDTNQYHTARKIKKQSKEKYLLYCGVEQLDDIFNKCYIPVKRADDLDSYYNLIMTRFQQTCLNCGFTKTIQASFEDCITGLNEALYRDCNFKLKVEDEEDFIKLSYPKEEAMDIPESVDAIVNIFNNEYSTICRTILRECPLLSDMLMKLDALLEKVTERLTEKYQEKAKRYINVCHQNQARIMFAKKQAYKCLKEVNIIRQKVNATLMW